MRAAVAARVVFAEIPRGSLDTASANEHGQPVFLLDWDEARPTDPGLPGRIDRMLQELGYHPDRDLVALSGGQATTAILLAVIAWRFPCVRVLVYSAGQRRYIERRITAPVRGRVT